MSFDYSEMESSDFNGIIRLFPLPNLVMFPGIIQPLHIFEPRYRQMVRHALEGDGLLATALYCPDWEDSLSDNPPLHDVITIGKIIAHTELEDGRSNILLKGLSRARIIREIPTELSYRMADVELLSESDMGCTSMAGMHSRLIEIFQEYRNSQLDIEPLDSSQLIEQDLSLGTMADMIAFSVDLGILAQQTILETTQVPARCQLLIELIENRISETHESCLDGLVFPPQFSFN